MEIVTGAGHFTAPDHGTGSRWAERIVIRKPGGSSSTSPASIISV